VFATAVNALVSDECVGEDTYVVGTGPLDREFSDLMRTKGVTADRIVSVTAQRGYSLGSAAGSALVEVWNKAVSGDRVVIVHCGDGLSAKVVLMRN
jgi:3-mercaptopyruvate sulfurtransferase SseA